MDDLAKQNNQIQEQDIFRTDLNEFFSTRTKPTLVYHQDAKDFISDYQRRSNLIYSLINNVSSLADDLTIFERKFFSIAIFELLERTRDDKIIYTNFAGQECNIVECAFNFDQSINMINPQNTRTYAHFLQHSIDYAIRLFNYYLEQGEIELAYHWDTLADEVQKRTRILANDRKDPVDEFHLLINIAKHNKDKIERLIELGDIDSVALAFEIYGESCFNAFSTFFMHNKEIGAELLGKNEDKNGQDAYARSRDFLIKRLILNAPELIYLVINRVLRKFYSDIDKGQGKYSLESAIKFVYMILACSRIVGIYELLVEYSKIDYKKKDARSPEEIANADSHLDLLRESATHLSNNIIKNLRLNNLYTPFNETIWLSAISKNKDLLAKVLDNLNSLKSTLEEDSDGHQIIMSRTLEFISTVLNPPNQRKENAKHSKKKSTRH